MRLSTVLSLFSLTLGISSLTIRQDANPLELPKSQLPNPAPGTIVSTVDGSNENHPDSSRDKEVKYGDSYYKTPSKLGKRVEPSYTPDFRQLCINRNLNYNTPSTARCVAGQAASFTHVCVDPVFSQLTTVTDYCRDGYFCEDVDARDNVNGQSTTIKCVDKTSSGTYRLDDQDVTETTPLCNKVNDGKNKFFGKIVKSSGVGSIIGKFFVKRGSGSYGLAGSQTTDGSYELSYNFDTGTSWCWYAAVYKNGESTAFTGEWDFGLVQSNTA